MLKDETKIRQNFIIKKINLEGLRKVKELTGTPISWQIDKAVEEYLKNMLYDKIK